MEFDNKTIFGCPPKEADHSSRALGMGDESPPPESSFTTSFFSTTLKANCREAGAQTPLPLEVARLPDLSSYRVLYLPIKKRWFDLVLSGEKHVEFRSRTPYYASRLNKKYDLVFMRNGYSSKSRFLIARFYDVLEIDHICHGEVYGIVLGKVLCHKR